MQIHLKKKMAATKTTQKINSGMFICIILLHCNTINYLQSRNSQTGVTSHFTSLIIIHAVLIVANFFLTAKLNSKLAASW